MLGVLGDLVEDIVVWLAEPLHTGTDTRARIHRTRGGSAANVAAFAAASYPTRFLGCVGDDATGDRLAGELAARGVEVLVQRRGTTGAVVLLVDEHGERTMLPDRGACVLFDDLDPLCTKDLTHLHVAGYSFATEPLSGTAAELLHRVASTSVDTSSAGLIRHYGVERFLSLLSALTPRWIFANRDEADVLGPALYELPSTIIVKNGDQPTTIYVPNSAPVHVPVATVADVRDSTGAGDAFAAGFLVAALTGADLIEACLAGHSTAALVLATPGAESR